MTRGRGPGSEGAEAAEWRMLLLPEHERPVPVLGTGPKHGMRRSAAPIR